MEFVELINEKKKVIELFFSTHRELGGRNKGNSHAASLAPLRAALKALDEPYQREYEATYHSKRGMHNGYYTKILFIDILKKLPLTAADISYVLDYDRDEVGWILSEPGNSYQPDKASIKAYRDANAIYKTNRTIGFIEGFVETFAKGFAEVSGGTMEEGRLKAARYLLEEGYLASTIAYATGIAASSIKGDEQ